jgi:hypothetical protein
MTVVRVLVFRWTSFISGTMNALQLSENIKN